MKRLTYIPLELLFWVSALIGLAVAKEEIHGHGSHSTLCLLANLGFDWCPGCGIGRAITHLLHGNLEASFAHHMLGVPALIIILFRIRELIMLQVKWYKNYKLL